MFKKICIKLRLGETSKSIVTLITGNSIAQVVNLLGIPILSRVYEPKAIGLLAIYVSAAAIFSVLAAGRYELAIVLPSNRDEAIKIKALSQWIVVIASIIAFILLLILMHPVSSWLQLDEYSMWIPGIAVLVLLGGFTSVLNYWHTRQKNFKVQSTNKVVLSLSVLVLQVVFGLLISNDLPSLLVGLIVGQTIAVVFLISKQQLTTVEQKIRIPEALALLRKYKKMPLVNGPNALVDGVRVNGLNFLIASVSPSSLGQFSMALRGVQAPVGLISQALSQVFLQKMAREERGHLCDTVLSIVRKGLLLAFVPFFVVFVISPKVFPILLGPGWELSGYFAQALVPWLFLNVVTSPLANLFIVTQTQGRLFIFAVFYMLVPLYVVYVLRADIIQAVWGLGLSMAVMLVIQICLALYTAKQDDLKYKRK